MNLAPQTQMIHGVRPLAIDAAYGDSFECLAPAAWTAAIVLRQLFKVCDMHRAGWTERDTILDDLGASGCVRRWYVARNQ